MKKVITIALAAVMTLTLAVSAFAGFGWDKVPTSQTTSPISVTIDQYEGRVSNMSGYYQGTQSYAAWDKNNAVADGTKVLAVINITVPKTAEWQAAYKAADYTTMGLIIKATNVENMQILNTTGFMTTSVTLNGAFNGTTHTLTADTFDLSDAAFTNASAATKGSVSVIYTAAADGEIVVTADIFSKVTNPNTGYADTFNFIVGDTTYAVTSIPAANAYDFIVGTNGVEFVTDANDKVVHINLAYNGRSEEVSKGADGAYLLDGVARAKYVAGTDAFDKAIAFFESVCKDLGFVWDNTTSYMTSKLVYTNLNQEIWVNATATYGAGVVVPNPNPGTGTNPEPPKTGDASSVFGFVMLAVAVLAAGAVAVKKVRA